MMMFELFIKWIIDLFIKPDREPERCDEKKPPIIEVKKAPRSPEILHETWSIEVINNDTCKPEDFQIFHCQVAAMAFKTRHQLGLLIEGAEGNDSNPQYSYKFSGIKITINSLGGADLTEEVYTVMGDLRLKEGGFYEVASACGEKRNVQGCQFVPMA